MRPTRTPQRTLAQYAFLGDVDATQPSFSSPSGWPPDSSTSRRVAVSTRIANRGVTRCVIQIRTSRHRSLNTLGFRASPAPGLCQRGWLAMVALATSLWTAAGEHGRRLR